MVKLVSEKAKKERSRRFLNYIRDLDRRIRIQKEMIERERELIEIRGYQVRERVSGTMSNDQIGEGVSKLLDMIESLDADLSEYVDEKQHAYELIQRLDPAEQTVLNAYYLQAKTIEATARDLCYSVGNIHRLKRKALLHFYGYLPTEWA